ncbi:MAG: hypothetical protein EA378_02565 [Phycisphaerales bacterium]|nr:MAG: hypothetical protein EA378_02565 [Phycisphaerales bacterium]
MTPNDTAGPASPPDAARPAPEPARVREAPTLGFEDLTRGLLWPMIFRAPALALRPARVGFALITIVLLALVGSISRLWSDTNYADRLADAFAGLVGEWLSILFLGGGGRSGPGPVEVVFSHPVSSIVLGVPMLAILAVGAGAISRSAAREFALNERDPWPRSLAFAAGRGVSFFFTLAIPILFVLAIYLTIAVAGFLLLTLPGVSIVGAVLFALALAAGLLAAVATLAGLLALPIFLAAMACEGADAIDAVQRAYAYAIARPIRLVVYIAIAELLGLVFIGVVALVTSLGVSFSLDAASAFGGRPLPNPDAGALWSASGAIVEFWIKLAVLLVGAIALSYLASAGVIVYLLIRRVVDGQHHQDLWSPPAPSAIKGDGAPSA